MVKSEVVLLNILASYVPRYIKRRLLLDPSPLIEPRAETFSASVLFADISGFTDLAERLARHSVAGAEELSYLLNIYIEEVIDVITLHGGDIVKFAGDALVAVWATGTTDEDLSTITHRAAQCGLLIQAMLHDQRPLEDIKLSLRVGVGAGEVNAVHVGGALGRWEALITGDPLTQMGQAEKQAEPGQVILSPEAWALVGERCQGNPLPGGAVQIEDVHSPLAYHFTPSLKMPPEAEAALRNYIPGAILSRLTAKQTDWLAELRRVTVLFVNLPDLDHTTPLPTVQRVMHTLQAALYRYEGSINKLSADDKGSSLVAALGLPPLAHEDDAVRGLQAALDMRAALRDLGIPGAIGVATGQSFCGVVGGQRRREYTMIGDVVNLSARLMQNAPKYVRDEVPILCDEVTYQSSQSNLDFEALPPIAVKGKTVSVPVYRPLNRKPRGISFKRGAADRGMLIGRRKERAVLLQEIQALLNDDPGKVIVIEGEAGIGKSQLLEELFYLAQEAGVTCLIGAGDAIEKSTPYYAWRGIFDQLFAIEGISDLSIRREYVQLLVNTYLDSNGSDLAPLFNDILPLDLPENDRTAGLSGQARAHHTRDLLARLLAKVVAGDTPSLEADNGASNPSPLILIIDDAQWMDSASWALTWEVSERVEPLLMVIATRLIEDPLPGEYLKILGRDKTRHLLLGSLPLKDALALVCRRLGVSDLPQGVANLIGEKAEGHPFFSQELANNLLDMGVLQIQNGACQLAPDADRWEELDFPHTIRGVITSRIDKLTPEQQLILKVASVIGRVFPYQILHDIHPVERDKTYLAADLQALARLDITPLESPAPDLAYIFKHISTQEVAYDLMLFSQRRQLHQAVAQWYERTYAADLTNYYSLLAYHWSKAVGDQPTETSLGLAKPKQIKTAIHYLTESGEQALRSYANQEAVQFFSRALNLLKALPETPEFLEQELELLVTLGNPLIAIKGFAAPEVAQTYTRARELCQKLEDTPKIFFVIQGLLGLYFTRAELRTAFALAEQLLTLSETLSDPFLRLKAQYGLGHTLMAFGKFEAAQTRLESAIALYQPGTYGAKWAHYPYQGVDPGVGAQAYAGLNLWFLGYPDQARATMQEALTLARTLANPVSLALAAGFAAVLCQHLGEEKGVQDWTDLLDILSEKHGFAFWMAWGKIIQSWTLARQGQVAAAIDQLQVGQTEHYKTGAALYRPYFLALLAEMYGQIGRPEQGLRLIEEVLIEVDKSGERSYEAELHRLRGMLLLLATSGESLSPATSIESEEAETSFKQAIQIARRQSARSLELRAAMSLSRYRQQQGQLEAARQILGEVYGRFDEGFDTVDLKEAKALLASFSPRY